MSLSRLALGCDRLQRRDPWEWTDDPYPVEHEHPRGACCAPAPEDRFPRMVIKGGSHLCAPSYCLRYRPAARQGETIDTSTSHLGFRCAIRAT